MSGSARTMKATVMDAVAVRRSLSRIAHEIVERNHGTEDLVMVGILSKGDVIARRLSRKLEELEGRPVTVGSLNVTGHRDDRHLRGPFPPLASSAVPSVDARVVVLTDDVLYHGRTARAAMDALLEFGRPRAIQLAVLVDRGHRELPIRPDYVGKNVPTSERELIEVCLEEVDGVDAVVLLEGGHDG